MESGAEDAEIGVGIGQSLFEGSWEEYMYYDGEKWGESLEYCS